MKSVKFYLLINIFLTLSLVSCYESKDVPEEGLVEPSEFTQKLLIEDYTGAWCVNCTGAGHAIELAASQNNQFIPLAIHFGTSSLEDPMNNIFSTNLVNQYNPNQAFPQVNLNRNETIWTNDYLTSTLEKKLNRYAPVGLAINSTINDDTINTTIKVGFVEETTSIDNYKLIVYLLEDQLIYPQHNGSLPDLPEIIEDYEHNNVLQYAFTSIFGDVLPNQITEDHRYSKEFSASIPDYIENRDNLKIIAFVVDSNDYCLNVQVANVGMNKDFD